MLRGIRSTIHDNYVDQREVVPIRSVIREHYDRSEGVPGAAGQSMVQN